MDALTIRYLDDLASCTKEDERVLALAKAEEKLMADAEASSLREAMLKAQENYAFTRKECGPDSEEAKFAQKAFYQAKLALDECPAAKEYSALFSQLNFLYWELDDILFHPFREK